MAKFQEHAGVFMKGLAMGAANVIPGVSGGTVAFITGIYERLIEALRSFDLEALALLRKGDFAGVAKHADLGFLLLLGGGSLTGIVTLARVLKWAFAHHEGLVWAFFFGLIAASVPAVGKMVRHWGVATVAALLLGLGIAVSMVFLGRAEANEGIPYLMLCGVVAVCSMIIPGLSGSFVLLLLGNYELVMVESVSALTSDPMRAIKILLPVGLGAVVGLASFAHFLSWLFRNYHDIAVAMITGFIAGSLAIIWPWKETVVETFGVADGKVKEKVTGFTNWRMPDLAEPGSWAAVLLMLVGAGLVLVMERSAAGGKRGLEARGEG